MTINKDYDAIIIGSGMGGMSTAAFLANDGYKVLILEAALHPGGCSSSYPRKDYVFESGATTLIGFDEHQPLRYLEEQTGIKIPKVELNPSMNVWLDGEKITRYKDRIEWIEEAVRVFGNRKGQRKFWKLAFDIADVVWKVSLKNPFFPPRKVSEWASLFTSNSPKDVWVLPYALKTVQQVAEQCGIATPKFLRFLDEQLMITAQNKSEDVPFLFGAAGITYTNYSNYYVPGGLLQMIYTIRDYVEERGGKLATKEAVSSIKKEGNEFFISTKKDRTYKAPIVVSNVPIWNMGELVDDSMKAHFVEESKEYEKAWGALTMGIATTDTYPDDLGIHHQIHLDGATVPHTNSESIFISMSRRGDTERAPEGERTLNISCHAAPELWFDMNGTYDQNKEAAKDFIIDALEKKLPGFNQAEIKLADLATPVTWQNWVYRKKGRVGGIPQSMARSLLKWTPSETPFSGLYLVGDTTYPGQGIPGVTLGGINVYSRIVKNSRKTCFSLNQFQPNTSFSLFPQGVKNLIFINGIIFLITKSIFTGQWTLFGQIGAPFLSIYPIGSGNFYPWQVVTYMFLHADLSHIFFNLFALWIFGQAIENLWGTRRFMIYYFITGIGAAVFYQLVSIVELNLMADQLMSMGYTATELERIVNSGSMSQGWPDLLQQYVYKSVVPTVGASGAVFGLLLAFGMMFPNQYIFLLFPPIPIKAKYFVAIYGIVELFSGLSRASSGIAHFAHLGGLVVGFVLIKLWKIKRPEMHA